MSREVPNGWKSVRVGDVAEIRTGGTPSRTEERYWGGDIPWMASGEIHQRYVSETAEKITELALKESNARILPAGSVMIALNGQGKTRGKAAILRKAMACNQSLAAIIPNTSHIPEFFLFLFEAMYSQLRNLTGDDARNGLNLAILKALELTLPPLHEQRRIAEILSSVDEAIAATRAVIEQTRKVKQGVLERLLTKGIGHTRFKQTEIGEIPEGWTVATLAEAGVAILDGDRGKEYPKAEDYQEEGYCLFLSAKNVTRSGFVFDECQFLSEEKHLKLRNGLLQRSDIVVTTRGTIGNFAFYGPDIEFVCLRINSGMALMRSIRSQIHPHFLFALTASKLIDDQLKRRVFGSAQPQLTLDILRKLVVPVPPEAEQVSITAQANDLLEIERHQRVQLTAIERFKSALMSDLLTGRKRVTDALPMAAE